MTNRLWPANAVGGAPAYDGRALRQTTVAPFTPLGNTARPLGGLSGVRFGTPTTTAAATSTTWTVRPHVGVVDLQTALEAGPYSYSIDAVQTGAVTPADATYPRVDVVYVTILDPAETGSGTPGVTVGYLAGTAAETPVAKAVPAQSMALYTISVPKSGGGAPTVTWVAPQVGGGGFVGYPTKAALDTWTTAPKGAHATVFADATPALNRDYVYDGAAWVFLVPIIWATETPLAVAATGLTTVTFPVNKFSKAPNVQFTVYSASTVGMPWTTGTTTAASAGVRIFTYAGAQQAGTVNVVAVQYAP